MENDDLRVLTVCQPWAWWIVHGGKRIENRPRPMTYRGPLLIHAGKSVRFHGTDGELIRDYTVSGIALPDVATLPHGAIVARAQVVDCFPVQEFTPRHRPKLGSQVKFACGPWCILLDNVEPLSTPIPWSGKLGLWRISAEEFDLRRAAAEGRILSEQRALPFAPVC